MHELRAHETNMLEIKTMAGFINYKVTSVLLIFDNLYLKKKNKNKLDASLMCKGLKIPFYIALKEMD